MASIRFVAPLIAGLALAGPAQAETQVFVLTSTDGYGIDRCLAAGERCGEAAATALCRARDFERAVDYGRVDPTEITGGLPDGMQIARCDGRGCPETIAITCTR